MSTGTTLFTRSLRMLGVLGSGQAASTNQLADGLVAINALLDSWRTEKLFVYATVDSSLTLVNGKQSYSIGSGGDLAITRPVRFDDAYVTQSSVDSPVTLITQAEWDSIPFKANSSPIPEYVFYNPTMASSLGTLLVYPVPSTGNVLHLIGWVQLVQLAAMTDAVLLPPGYDRAISSSLAIEIAPEYPGVTVTPELAAIAREAKANIKRANINPIRMGSELARLLPNRSGTSRILTGP